MYPSEYLYSREHEWVRVEDDVCVLGITEFAQQELGEVVFVELPEVGQVFDSGDEVGTIESVKAVAEVYTPVAGEVVEVNDAVVDDPELLNEDPHGEGWLIKIRFSSAADLKSLMNAEQYEEFVKSGEAKENRPGAETGRPLRRAILDGTSRRVRRPDPRSHRHLRPPAHRAGRGRGRRDARAARPRLARGLVEETVPGLDPPARRRSTLAPARRTGTLGEHELLDRAARPGGAQPGLPLVPRHGLPRLHHARR